MVHADADVLETDVQFGDASPHQRGEFVETALIGVYRRLRVIARFAQQAVVIQLLLLAEAQPARILGGQGALHVAQRLFACLYGGFGLLLAGGQVFVLTLLGKQRQVQCDHGGHLVGSVTAIGVVAEALAIFNTDIEARFVLFTRFLDALLIGLDRGARRPDGGVFGQCRLQFGPRWQCV